MYLKIVLIFLCTTFSTSQVLVGGEDALKKVISEGVTLAGAGLLNAVINETEAEQNILISPLNVYTALALIHLGSKGNTQRELNDILGIPDTNNKTFVQTHGTLSEVLRQIEGKTNRSSSSSFTESALANGLFVQNNFKIKRSYINSAEKFYKVSPVSVDFAGQPRKATDIVNRWVASKTKNRISQLYNHELERSTTVLLTCALYFSGIWSEAFPKQKTRKAKFTTKNNEKIDVDLMNNVKKVPYIEDSSYQYEAIRLPYEKNEYEMIIVLPSGQQTLDNLTAHLEYDDGYQKLFNDPGTYGMENGIDYKIPRMKFSWSESIKEALKLYGVETLFERADLSNLVEGNNLRVSDITHATEIEVNEKGTRASAITAIKFVPYIYTQDPPKPKPFVVDRPFLMMIYNRPTSTLLFYGCVYNPIGSVE